jgi:sugar transferase EpsL
VIYRIAKRLLDLAVASAVLLLFAPVILLTAVLVRIRLGRPVLFVQERPGLHGRPFRLYKFRTMTDARDADGNLQDDDVRLTPLGRVLRRFSLDEFPQLFNVLRGDLSLVGPRPLLMEYLPLYSPEQARRHDVKPGITGWSQVNGRNAITWPERLRLDVWYVDHQTMWLDLQILLITVAKVVRGADVSQQGRATVEKFKGTSEG